MACVFYSGGEQCFGRSHRHICESKARHLSCVCVCVCVGRHGSLVMRAEGRLGTLGLMDPNVTSSNNHTDHCTLSQSCSPHSHSSSLSLSLSLPLSPCLPLPPPPPLPPLSLPPPLYLSVSPSLSLSLFSNITCCEISR